MVYLDYDSIRDGIEDLVVPRLFQLLPDTPFRLVRGKSWDGVAQSVRLGSTHDQTRAKRSAGKRNGTYASMPPT